MFGHNEIVGQKYFKDADKLLVTSIFYTLQGEGPFAGLPAVFVRLAKCNLACDFCDTYFDSGDWMTVEEVMQKAEDVIKKYYNDKVPQWAQYGGTFLTQRDVVLVITGGEPTLQNKMLNKLLEQANKEYVWTQIETNGIIAPDIPLITQVVCSPKIVNGKYVNPHKNLMDRACNKTWKFIVEADINSPYHYVPEWAYNEDNRFSVYISPMNIYTNQPLRTKDDLETRSKEEIISFWTPNLLNNEINRRNHEYAAQLCMKHGFRLNLQMQLYASLP